MRRSSSYSFGLPIEIDYSLPHGCFWSSVFNAEQALDQVVAPLVRCAKRVYVYGYNWEVNSTSGALGALRTRIEDCFLASKRGSHELDASHDLITGMERFWLGGIPRVMTAVPLVVVSTKDLEALSVPLSKCSADGATAGSNKGLFSSAVRAAKLLAKEDLIAFIFRGEELEMYFPHSDPEVESLAQIIEDVCMDGRSLRDVVRSAVRVEMAHRRSLGELV